MFLGIGHLRLCCRKPRVKLEEAGSVGRGGEGELKGAPVGSLEITRTQILAVLGGACAVP